jgi:hypothetical protein
MSLMCRDTITATRGLASGPRDLYAGCRCGTVIAPPVHVFFEGTDELRHALARAGNPVESVSLRQQSLRRSTVGSCGHRASVSRGGRDPALSR